jgi:hypothetical protein
VRSGGSSGEAYPVIPLEIKLARTAPIFSYSRYTTVTQVRKSKNSMVCLRGVLRPFRAAACSKTDPTVLMVPAGELLERDRA